MGHYVTSGRYVLALDRERYYIQGGQDMEKNEQGEVIVGGMMYAGEPWVNCVEFAAKLQEFRQQFKAGSVKKAAGYDLRDARKKGNVQGIADASWQSGWAAGYEDGVTAASDLLYTFVRWVRDQAKENAQ